MTESTQYAVAVFRRARERAITRGESAVPLQIFQKAVRQRNDATEALDDLVHGYSLGPGFPRALTGPKTSRRDPVTLGSGISHFMREHSQEISRARLKQKWAELVGPDIAKHTEVCGYDGNKLIVQCDQTGWAYQLRKLTPSILNKIDAAALGVEAIIVRGPNTVSWKNGPLSVRGRGPRDTYG